MILNKTVVVVGAGISGLCVAYFLKREGVDVVVLESDSAVGGTMKTIRDDSWLVETGPNSALETTPLFGEIFHDLHLEDKRVYANAAAKKRYVVKNGSLHPLPMDLFALMKSRLWSWPGKLRLLKEPFVGRAKREETVGEFVRRRLGSEFLDYAVNPFVAGVYAGDPEQLSVQVAFPKLYALEERYGGLIKGMLLGRKERKARAEKARVGAELFSFAEGMQSFPHAIAARLGDSVKLNVQVETIIPVRAGHHPVYTIYGPRATPIVRDAAAAVLATPAYVTSGIIRPIDPETASTLGSIYYAPVAEVFMGFRAMQVKRPLDGFGFLVPHKEKRSILGTIWSSTLFPNRSPEGFIALTAFVGGVRQPELVNAEDRELTRLVLNDLHDLMRVEGQPAYVRIIRWEKAIPQYTLRYKTVLDAIDRFEQNFRGAFLCSNYRGGIAVGDCVRQAKWTAERVLKHLEAISRASLEHPSQDQWKEENP
jgi:oxygen-dependent protoporphyrinogen oxidase